MRVRSIMLFVAALTLGGLTAVLTRSWLERHAVMAQAAPMLHPAMPTRSILVAHRALEGFFRALKASPTGMLAGQSQWVTTFEQFTDAVGLKDYRAREERYLPKPLVEAKYHGETQIVR